MCLGFFCWHFSVHRSFGDNTRLHCVQRSWTRRLSLNNGSWNHQTYPVCLFTPVWVMNLNNNIVLAVGQRQAGQLVVVHTRVALHLRVLTGQGHCRSLARSTTFIIQHLIITIVHAQDKRQIAMDYCRGRRSYVLAVVTFILLLLVAVRCSHGMRK